MNVKCINPLFFVENSIKQTLELKKKLEMSEMRFQAVAQTAINSIIITDENNSIIFFNKTAQKTFGYLEEEILGKNVNIIMPEKYRDQHDKGVKRFLSTGVPKLIGHIIEIEGLRKNGEIFPLELALSFWKEKNEIFFTGIINDITERKEAEKKIRQLNIELEEKVKMRTSELSKKNAELVRINSDLDNFIYTASHDLKAPIMNIEALINLLMDSLGEDCLNKDDNEIMIKMISTSVIKFKNTIQELADMGRIQKNINEDIEDINISELIEEIKISIHDEIEKSNAEIKADTSEAPMIKFSKKDLRSILYNLISNAIKFRDPNRKLEISIKTKQSVDHTILLVKDNGLGVPLRFKDKIFGMFKRFHTHAEGTGVGLYIVKRIIDNNNGKIEMESEVGKGTTFKVYFRI
jgi:two-component system, sensor histidine kinase